MTEFQVTAEVAFVHRTENFVETFTAASRDAAWAKAKQWCLDAAFAGVFVPRGDGLLFVPPHHINEILINFVDG